MSIFALLNILNVCRFSLELNILNVCRFSLELNILNVSLFSLELNILNVYRFSLEIITNPECVSIFCLTLTPGTQSIHAACILLVSSFESGV